MSNNSFYLPAELAKIGFLSFGSNVLISRKASIYSPEEMRIGDNVRIDDFCILSGKIQLGSCIHISAYAALYGQFGIEIDNYSGISPRSTIFSGSDDFSGNHLIGPMVPEQLRYVIGGKVTLEKYVQIGASSNVMPNITLHEGSVIGAMSLVRSDTEPWSVNVGIPSKKIKEREKSIVLKLMNNQNFKSF